MISLSPRNLSATLLIVSFSLNLISNLLFTGRSVLKWYTGTPAFLNWERGLLVAAYMLGALGVALLEGVLRDAGETALSRMGSTTFLIGAVVALVVEASFLSGTGTPQLTVIMVVTLFVAEAILGGALLVSGALPAWVGWTVVAWNVGWLVVLPIATPRDIYFPILHFMPALFIGITLLTAH